MNTQSVARNLTIPQADGDCPIDPTVPLGDYLHAQGRVLTGPVPVLVHKSGPAYPPVLSIAERDRQLADLVPVMVRLLYRAMQLHSLGVIDDVALEDMPERTRTKLTSDAVSALNRQSNLYRNEAQLTAKNKLHELLDSTAFHFPMTDLSAQENPAEQRSRERHARELVDLFKRCALDELVTEEVEKVYAQPLKMSPRTQEIRTALAGMVG